MRMIAATAAVSVLAGCATVDRRLDTAENRELCKSYVVSQATKDWAVEQDRVREMTERGLSRGDCSRMLGNDRWEADTVLAVGVAVLAVAAIVAIAKRGGGGDPSTDYQWDWDLFYDEHRQLMWACRGVQSGQFADAWRCAGKARTDARWPSLSMAY